MRKGIILVCAVLLIVGCSPKYNSNYQKNKKSSQNYIFRYTGGGDSEEAKINIIKWAAEIGDKNGFDYFTITNEIDNGSQIKINLTYSKTPKSKWEQKQTYQIQEILDGKKPILDQRTMYRWAEGDNIQEAREEVMNQVAEITKEQGYDYFVVNEVNSRFVTKRQKDVADDDVDTSRVYNVARVEVNYTMKLGEIPDKKNAHDPDIVLGNF